VHYTRYTRIIHCRPCCNVHLLVIHTVYRRVLVCYLPHADSNIDRPRQSCIGPVRFTCSFCKRFMTVDKRRRATFEQCKAQSLKYLQTWPTERQNPYTSPTTHTSCHVLVKPATTILSFHVLITLRNMHPLQSIISSLHSTLYASPAAIQAAIMSTVFTTFLT